MAEITELFGQNVDAKDQSKMDWKATVEDEHCPFTNKICIKSGHKKHKIKLGTCMVTIKKHNTPLILCPQRFLHNQTIFKDCVKLMDKHQPDNEIRLIPEFKIPGGKVDFILQSVKNDKVMDFIGIEFQAISTTGTLLNRRYELLQQLKLIDDYDPSINNGGFGINWKHISKTILPQMNHKVHTFENLGKKLVLVVQKELFQYFQTEFNFSHLSSPANMSHPMHYYVYRVVEKNDEYVMELDTHHSTTAKGAGKCLDYVKDNAVPRDVMMNKMEKKNFTILTI